MSNENSTSEHIACKPVGSGDYIVASGEGVSSIAARAGLFWSTIWDHPGNADLKAARDDPEVLLPGDRLLIPARRPKEAHCSTGMRHVFRRRGVPLRLRVRLADKDGQAFGGKRYVLTVMEVEQEGYADGNGMIERWVAPAATEAILQVWLDEAQAPCEWLLQIGQLAPQHHLTGVQARLKNLGYAVSDAQGEFGASTRAALRAFQHKHGLAVTGDPDPATRARLHTMHRNG